MATIVEVEATSALRFWTAIVAGDATAAGAIGNGLTIVPLVICSNNGIYLFDHGFAGHLFRRYVWLWRCVDRFGGTKMWCYPLPQLQGWVYSSLAYCRKVHGTRWGIRLLCGLFYRDNKMGYQVLLVDTAVIGWIGHWGIWRWMGLQETKSRLYQGGGLPN